MVQVIDSILTVHLINLHKIREDNLGELRQVLDTYRAQACQQDTNAHGYGLTSRNSILLIP